MRPTKCPFWAMVIMVCVFVFMKGLQLSKKKHVLMIYSNRSGLPPVATHHQNSVQRPASGHSHSGTADLQTLQL